MLSKQIRIMAHGVAVALLTMGASLTYAQEIPGHPGPQPRTGLSTQELSEDGMTTFAVTPEGQHPPQDPFVEPPGSNFLGDTVYENMRDALGNEMPNTLASTPDNPYNLHPDPVVSEINPTSPIDDLRASLKKIRKAAEKRNRINTRAIQRAIDILEGNPIPDRVYSGFPMLHYTGPERVKKVVPERDEEGNVIGGRVDIHQIWFDTFVMSDAMFVDPSEVREVPWTIHYTVDVLNRGHDDFAPAVIYWDHPDVGVGVPHVGIDQTFFPMEDGTRTEYEIAMSKAKYWNLTYHWGWRKHPPRIQALENATKVIPDPETGEPRTLPEWESFVFGEAPTSSKRAKLKAIGKIGDLSPAKRMWKTLRKMKRTSRAKRVLRLLERTERAFDQWQNRNKLPDGVKPDPDSDWTMLYVNNTFYGELPEIVDNTGVKFRDWTTRGKTVKIKLYNADYFRHLYRNVDFGGSRGWENSFHDTIDIGGAGPWFSFGRFHWWPNAGAPPQPILVPAAEGHGRNLKLGEHNVELTLNFEPSRRLRIYQFDPLHHDVAIWSIH